MLAIDLLNSVTNCGELAYAASGLHDSPALVPHGAGVSSVQR